jgi:hypothetical protein
MPEETTIMSFTQSELDLLRSALRMFEKDRSEMAYIFRVFREQAIQSVADAYELAQRDTRELLDRVTQAGDLLRVGVGLN